MDRKRSDRAPRLDSRPEPGSFGSVLSRLARELDRGEALVERAVTARPGRLSAGDWIALQAGIYRYAEAVDLTAKLIDRTSAAVKTTVGSGGS